MKIIISHDVDHIYSSDHYLKDLIIPKLLIRSLWELLSGSINLQVLYFRFISLFEKRLNRIPQIIHFDKTNLIPSVFFFGMDSILGMSYKKESAARYINFVLENGFDAGVHGVEYDNSAKMQNEFNEFRNISKIEVFGIRTHYVRYNENTFKIMAKLGYLFDTSEFNKFEIELKHPYKVEDMWEFPLHIMDCYILKDDLERAKSITIEAINMAIMKDLEYFTFLFHDHFFNVRTYPNYKEYYEWFIKYCKKLNLQFISYREAILELESKLD